MYFAVVIVVFLLSFVVRRYYHLLMSFVAIITYRYRSCHYRWDVVGDVRDAFDEPAQWWGKCDAVEREGSTSEQTTPRSADLEPPQSANADSR